MARSSQQSTAVETQPQPLYRKLKQHILDKVKSSEWPPGYRIPSELQLVSEFGMSRMTVNRALRELTQDGILTRLQGVGTFVKEPARKASLLELVNIAEEIELRGGRHTMKVMLQETVTTDAELAGLFETTIGTEVFHLVLIHLDNQTPLQIEDRYVNPAVAPGFQQQDFSEHTPTEYLLSVAPVDELEHIVKAAMPTQAERDMLAIDEYEPCLVLHRRSWSRSRVASVVNLTYPASRYQLRGRYKTSPAGKLEQ